MSLFGSLMRDMERDPIFGAHSRAMNQMNRMMNSMMGGLGGMGMGGMGMGGMGMIESPFGPADMGYQQQGGHPGGHPQHHRGHAHDMMMPFGGLMSPFGPPMGMGGGFPDFNQLMSQGGNNGHSFSSMSVTSISSGPDGRPQVYQASKQTASGPGGVKETRKAVSDTRTGTKKLAVGRHMGERAHVREREENMFTGQREDNEEFVNLDEEEAEDFDREWKSRAYRGGNRYAHSASMPAITGVEHHHQRNRDHRHNRQPHAHTNGHPQIGYPTRPSESTPSVTIEELPPSDDEEVGRNTGTPQSTASMPSASSSRRSPYTRERKPKSRRVKKY